MAKNHKPKQKSNPKPGEETFVMKSSTFRSKICEFFKKGVCTKGDECNFSHNYKPKILKNKLCKFFLTNNCQKENCYFSHDLASYPCMYLQIGGKCGNLLSCKFSHQAFGSKIDLKEYILEHGESIKQHIDRGITTPLNVYAKAQHYFADKFIQDPNLEFKLVVPGVEEQDEEHEQNLWIDEDESENENNNLMQGFDGKIEDTFEPF